MKYLAGISVVFLIFVFPALGYFYLNKGKEYRRNLLDQMEVKANIQELVSQSAFRNIDTIKSKVLLVHKKDAMTDEQKEYITKITDQFEKSPQFRYIQIDKNNFEFVDSFKNDYLYLVNSLGEVLNGYTYEREEIKSLIAHIAVALPLEKRRKVHLKRDIIQK